MFQFDQNVRLSCAISTFPTDMRQSQGICNSVLHSIGRYRWKPDMIHNSVCGNKSKQQLEREKLAYMCLAWNSPKTENTFFIYNWYDLHDSRFSGEDASRERILFLGDLHASPHSGLESL